LNNPLFEQHPNLNPIFQSSNAQETSLALGFKRGAAAEPPFCVPAHVGHLRPCTSEQKSLVRVQLWFWQQFWRDASPAVLAGGAGPHPRAHPRAHPLHAHLVVGDCAPGGGGGRF
jgi:hypothetical protein